ncbi:hypothetical protein AAC387_Pa02g0035 [Persea americana]
MYMKKQWLLFGTQDFQSRELKERSEKLELRKAREAMMEQKRNDKNELLRRQSSMWVDEHDLEKKILEAIVDTTSLESRHVNYDLRTLAGGASELEAPYLDPQNLAAPYSLVPVKLSLGKGN